MLEVVRINLSPSQIRAAAHLGVDRQLEAIKKNLSEKHGSDREQWDRHIKGCLAEMAVAKYFGMFYTFPINEFKKPDVGIYQVRHNGMTPPQLIVRDSDKSEEIFICVTSESMDSFILQGWMYGYDAKQEKYKRDPGGRGPAYFVPTTHLRLMSDIFKVVK